MSVSRRHILDETPLKKDEMSVSRRHILDETPVKMCRQLTVTQQYYESRTKKNEMSVSRRLTVTQQYYESLTDNNEMGSSTNSESAYRNINDVTSASLTHHHFSFFIFTVQPIVQTD